MGPSDRLEHGAHLGAGGGRRGRARRDLVRDTTGRAVPLDRPRRELADGARAVGPSHRKKWMGGGADLPGIHSIWSIRAIPGKSGSRYRPAASGSPGCRRELDAARQGHARRICAAGAAHDPIAQDVHCLVAVPAAPERMWVQHHNGIFARPTRAAVHRDHRGRAVRRSASRWRFIRATPIPPGSCPRSRTRSASHGRQACGDANPRRRQEL